MSFKRTVTAVDPNDIIVEDELGYTNHYHCEACNCQDIFKPNDTVDIEYYSDDYYTITSPSGDYCRCINMPNG